MVIPKIYYQYELAHFKGNMGHDATSDVVGAGGVLGLCPCGSYYALAATATVAAAGGRIGCSCVQPQMQLSAVVASAAAVCSRAGCKSAAAAAAAAAAAQCWRRWWKWAHSLGFETQQSNVAAAESSRGGRVSCSAAAEALAAAAQRSSVGGNGSRRCSAGIGGSGSAAQPLAAAVQHSHWRSTAQRCRRQRQPQLRRRHWWYMKNLCIRQKVNPFNYK